MRAAWPLLLLLTRDSPTKLADIITCMAHTRGPCHCTPTWPHPSRTLLPLFHCSASTRGPCVSHVKLAIPINNVVPAKTLRPAFASRGGSKRDPLPHDCRANVGVGIPRPVSRPSSRGGNGWFDGDHEVDTTLGGWAPGQEAGFDAADWGGSAWCGVQRWGGGSG